MSSTVVQSSDFNTSNISFSQVKVLDNGGKQAYLNYGGRSLLMQTASMAAPYGMSMYDKNGPKQIKYSVDLSFRGYEDENSKVAAFYRAMTELDEFMIDQGVKNSQAWFKEKLPREVIKAFYTPLVRVSKDAKGNLKPYPPSFKVSLKQRKGTDAFDVQTYDDKKNPYEGVPLKDLLIKGSQVTVLIQCTGLWFAGSKYGLSWKAVQIRVDKLPESIRGFAFADEEGGESNVQVQHHEEDEEQQEEQLDEEEVFQTPAPAPAPVVTATKKSVVAAVTAPAPAPAPQTLDDEAENAEPINVPKRAVVTKKKVVTTAAKK